MAGSTRTGTLATASANNTNTLPFASFNTPSDVLNAILEVTVGGEEDAEGIRPTVTGVTYGGVPLTLGRQRFVDDSGNAFSCAVSKWYLRRPTPNTTANIVVTFAATCNDIQGTAVILEGLEDQAPEASNDNIGEDATPINTSVTTLTNTAFITDGVVNGAGTAQTTNQAGQTARSSVTNTSSILSISDKQGPSSPGATTMGWAVPNNNRQVHVVLAWAAIPTPSVSGVSSGAPTYVLSGETGVVVTGTGFQATQGTGKVEFWSDAAGTLKQAQTITSWSNTSITLTAALGAITQQSGYFVVTNGGGQVSAIFRVVLLSAVPDYQVEITRASARTTAGTQDLTSAAMGTRVPKFAEIWIVRATADGRTEHTSISKGAMVSASERGCVAWSRQDAVATTNTNRSGRNDSVVFMINPTTSAVEAQADFVAFIAGGVRINFTTAPGSGYQLVARLWTGTLLQARISEFTAPAATQVVSGIGYDPELVFIDHVGVIINNAIDTAASIPGAGVAHCRGPGGTINQFCYSQNDQNGVGTTDVSAVVFNNRIAAQLTTAGALAYEHTIDVIAADRDTGYRIINQSGAPGTDEFMATAVHAPGLGISVGEYNFPTATGDDDNVVAGFQPQHMASLASMCVSFNSIEADQDGAPLMYGMVTGEQSQAIGWDSDDGAGTSNTASNIEDRTVFLRGSSGILIAGDATAFHGDGGWRINFTNVQGTARRGFYMALQEHQLDKDVSPAVAAVSVSGSVTSLRDTTVLVAGSASISGSVAVLNTVVFPDRIPIAVTGYAPIPSAAAGVLFVPDGFLAISEKVPFVSAPVSFSPSTAAVVAAGIPPALNDSVLMSVASVAVSGKTAVPNVEINFNPLKGSILISGSAITFGSAVKPDVAFLAFDGTVIEIGIPKLFQPPTAGITVTGEVMEIAGASIWIPDVPPTTIWIDYEATEEEWEPLELPAPGVWSPDSVQMAAWRELRAERGWLTEKLDSTRTEDWDIPTEEMTGGRPRTVWT